jgi:hypothetical protein
VRQKNGTPIDSTGPRGRQGSGAGGWPPPPRRAAECCCPVWSCIINCVAHGARVVHSCVALCVAMAEVSAGGWGRRCPHRVRWCCFAAGAPPAGAAGWRVGWRARRGSGLNPPPAPRHKRAARGAGSGCRGGCAGGALGALSTGRRSHPPALHGGGVRRSGAGVRRGRQGGLPGEAGCKPARGARNV